MFIKSIYIKNFKGCKSLRVNLGEKGTVISGANGSGKTTIFDAFTWLLFGKDSLDSAKFEIRPLDEKGNPVHQVVIAVHALVMVGNREIELKKEQKENWVKKRGSETATLQGNVNKFEIDGYPKSEKEFKEYVNGIIDEKLFKMLTSATYFPNMPWKEQRAVVMKLAEKITDVEMAKKLKKFEPLLDELGKAPSTDDIKAKYTKTINELKKKQTEIPIRIDEIEKSKSDIDIADLELQKSYIISKISDLKAELATIDDGYAANKVIVDGLMELKFKQSNIARELNEDYFNKKSNLNSAKTTFEMKVADINSDIRSLNDIMEKKNITAAEYSSEIAELNKKLKEIESTILGETNCPYCGSEYPAEKLAEIKLEFEKNKSKEIKDIEKKLAFLLDATEQITVELLEKNALAAGKQKELKAVMSNIEKIDNRLSELVAPNIENDEEYKAITQHIKEKEKALNSMNNSDGARVDIQTQIDDLQHELNECEKKLALSLKNDEIEHRINELKAELKDVGSKIVSQEKILYLLEEFIKYKLDKLNKDINSVFDGVSFILFKNQINGGVAETCECNVNGVPYNSLNYGHRIIAGLQIIKALQKMHNAYLPVFVDNSEAINDFNIPTMNCQLIRLRVSDDKEIKIESED